MGKKAQRAVNLEQMDGVLGREGVIAPAERCHQRGEHREKALGRGLAHEPKGAHALPDWQLCWRGRAVSWQLLCWSLAHEARARLPSDPLAQENIEALLPVFLSEEGEPLATHGRQELLRKKEVPALTNVSSTIFVIDLQGLLEHEEKLDDANEQAALQAMDRYRGEMHTGARRRLLRTVPRRKNLAFAHAPGLCSRMQRRTGGAKTPLCALE